MRLLFQSSRRFLYRHPGQLILALIGIAAGVAVVTGVVLMRDVLVNALDLAGEELAGRDSLRIQHPAGRLDESILTDLATQAGAPVLVPVLTARVRTNGRILELLATDPLMLGADERLRLGGDTINALMRTATGVALNADTMERLGTETEGRFNVHIAGGEHQLVVAAVLPATRALDDRLLMDIAVAQDMLGKAGELTWIEAPAGSRDWLVERLPEGLVVTEASERRDSAAKLTAGMRANLTAMSLISLAVGLFVIYSVLSFLLVQRRASFGMLRAVGVSQGRISLLLAIETALLAGVGALLGLALGTVLADSLLELIRQPVAELYRLLPPLSVQPTAGLYAGLWILAMVLAQASTLAVWREARQIPPGQLVRWRHESASNPMVPAAAALLLISALAVIALSQSLPAALIGLFVGLMGFALLAPMPGMALIRLLRLPWPHRLPGRALIMLGAGRKRIAPAISALSLALALSAGIGMMVLGFRGTVDDWIDRFLRADAYLTVSRGTIDENLTRAVGELESIAALSSARQIRLPDGRRLIAYDLPDAAWQGFEWLAGDSDRARAEFVAGSAVLLSEPFARRHDRSVGDRLRLHAPNGPLELPVAAVYRDYGSDQGTIAIHAPLYREHWNDPVRDSLGLYLAGTGIDPESLHAQLLDLDERIVLTSRDQVRRQTMAVFDRTFRISWALAVLVGIIAIIALVSALLALGLERRRDYATLRALGLTRSGLAAVVVTQTTGLAAAAALVAIPLSLAIHLGLSLVIQPRAFGWTLPVSWPLAPLAVMLPLAILAGLTAGLYPAWRIARRGPAPELRQG